MANPQYRNVGNLGDILKHSALVELAVMMNSRAGNTPVTYVETHAFVLRAPVADAERWRREVEAELQTWPSYKRYYERERREVQEGYYRCSCGLAIDFLPHPTLHIAEADAPTRNILQAQLAAESVTPACLLAEAPSLTEAKSPHEGHPLLMLVDPFDLPHEYWAVVNHFTRPLCDSGEAGAVEVFAYGEQPVQWPEPPQGCCGPVATMDRAPFHLGVYAAESCAAQAQEVLSRLGWKGHAV